VVVHGDGIEVHAIERAQIHCGHAVARRVRAFAMGVDAAGRAEAVRDDVLRRTVSGGVTVNDTLMHIAHDNLPFGGVGDSGWGAYHGEQGFLRFCHQKSVLVQSRWAMGSLFYPPYGARFDQVMGLLRRWL